MQANLSDTAKATGSADVGSKSDYNTLMPAFSVMQPAPQALKPTKSAGLSPRLAQALFILGLILYLFTRFYRLAQFPLTFFADEAIQTMSAFDLIHNGFRSPTAEFLPVYFQNGGQYNLSISVYLQVLIAWLPRSVWLTRGLPALVSLVFPLCVGLSLKRHFKLKTWFLAPFLISALPCWFLHSRTALETGLGTSLFTLYVYFYLVYRLQDRRYLPLCLLFGALAFYCYSPLQMVVVLSGILLLFSDLRFHFADRGTVLRGVFLLLVLAIPYFAFQFTHAEALRTHLGLLGSYWLGDLPLVQKIGLYLQRVLQGLSPVYWFGTDPADLARHLVPGRAHLPLYGLPLLLIGLFLCLKNWKESQNRLLLLSLLVAPSGAALVDISITRVLVFCVPFAFLACLGLEFIYGWLRRFFKATRLLPLLFCLILSVYSLTLCFRALQTIPQGQVWGLYGGQWGGQVLFDEIAKFRDENPQRELLLSPSWANNTDVLARFFAGDPLPFKIRTIEPFALYRGELDANMVFVMTPDELQFARKANKFCNIQVLNTLACPDGSACFHFVSLEYVQGVDAIFARERLERRALQEASFPLMGREVQFRFSLLDMGSVENAFDGKPETLLRGFEANPLVIELDFSAPLSLQALGVLVGSPATRLELEGLDVAGQSFRFTVENAPAEEKRELRADFGRPIEVRHLRISLSNLGEEEPAHVHLWEVFFYPPAEKP